MACGDHHGHSFLLFRDYFSLLYHPETSKSDGVGDDDGHLFLIVFEIIAVPSAIQREVSPMACGIVSEILIVSEIIAVPSSTLYCFQSY